MLSDAEKTDIRRYCGYPVYGNAAEGSLGWRFYQSYGLLEFRMLHLSAAEEAVARSQLANLAKLDSALASAGDNLDTAQAASWTRNKSEPIDRARLLDELRRRLCGFLGVPPGPALGSPGLALIV